MKGPKVKKCPFCKKGTGVQCDIGSRHNSSGKPKIAAQCNVCYATGALADTWDGALVLWNTRGGKNV